MTSILKTVEPKGCYYAISWLPVFLYFNIYCLWYIQNSVKCKNIHESLEWLPLERGRRIGSRMLVKD